METTFSAQTPPARALFKNMLKGSVLYMIAMAAPSLASLILVPIVTRHLTTSEYGVLDLFQQVSVVISVLLGVNFSSALGYFYFQPDAVKPRVVSTTLAGALLLGTVAGAVGWVFADPISRLVLRSPVYIPYLRLIFAAMPLSFLLEAGFSWLRAEGRTSLFTGAVLLRLGFIVAGTLILLLYLGLRIGAVLGANILAVSVVSLAIAAIGIALHGLSFDLVLFKRMLRFAMPLSMSALALFVIHFGDRFILPRYRAFEDLGIYAVAYKLGMLISLVQAAFEAYWSSQIYQIVKRPDAASVFSRTFTYLMLTLSFCALGVLVATKPALRIMTPPVYFRAAALVPILLLAYYIRALGDFFRHLFLAQGLPRHDAACNWITAAASIAAYLLLIPPYGIMGAAVATLLTFVVAAVLSMLWSYRVWPYRLELGRVGKLFAVTGGLSAIHLALPPSTIAMEVAEGAGLLAAFAGLLFLWQFPSPVEKEMLRSAASRLALFFA
jgi:O-antigen/teichoic acid export membrane protein